MDEDNNEIEHLDAYANWLGGAERDWRDYSQSCWPDEEEWRNESNPEISQMIAQWGRGKGEGAGPGFGK